MWRRWSPLVKWHVFEQMENADRRQLAIEKRGKQNISQADVDAHIIDSVTENGEFKHLAN